MWGYILGLYFLSLIYLSFFIRITLYGLLQLHNKSWNQEVLVLPLYISFAKLFLSSLGPLNFHAKFRTRLSISAQNLLGISLNHTSIWRESTFFFLSWPHLRHKEVPGARHQIWAAAAQRPQRWILILLCPARDWNYAAAETMPGSQPAVPQWQLWESTS